MDLGRILLVNPEFERETTSYEAVADLPFLRQKAFMTPLPLATLAALTPEGFSVDLWDEAVHGRVEDALNLPSYDLVGVTGYQSQARRACEIARFFRPSATVIGGGPGVSAAPETYRPYFDVLFIGEAEHTWSQFLDAWKDGRHLAEYRQISKPELAESPLPKWDSIAADLRYYFTGAVQATRGCPFDCEFCDVIFLYGRKPRNKPIDRVLAEVVQLERLGIERIFFCDDNFIGNPRYAKELLRGLIELNDSFDYPISFSTQITLNVAKDETLLALLADANFSCLYIGVETPRKDSLIETNKPQNFKTDILEDIRTIQSYALPVRAGMVVGFDHDDLSIFEEQLAFIQRACIPVVTINMLKAPPGTKLWLRLHKESRVLRAQEKGMERLEDMTYRDTNILPALMSRRELMEGFCQLISEVNTWERFVNRLKGFISGVRRPPEAPIRKLRPGAVDPSFLRQLFRHGKNPTMNRSIQDILDHTYRDAPFLAPKVFEQILQFIGVVGLAETLQETVTQQLVREESMGDIRDYVDHRPIRVPEAFRENYAELFRLVYDRLLGTLKDQTAVPDALVQVFSEFLARWGVTFRSLEEQHRADLIELVDRTVAARNQEMLDEPAYPGEAFEGRGEVRQLQIETLKFIERELRAPRATRRARA